MNKMTCKVSYLQKVWYVLVIATQTKCLK